MKIRFKKHLPDLFAVPPRRATEAAAGFDLSYSGPVINLDPGDRIALPTNLCVALPAGTVGIIKDRSGMALKRGLTTRAGVIDADYRGEIMVVVINETEDWITIKRGERIAQLLIVPCLMQDAEIVDDLGSTDRGAAGFGSTGI